MIRDQQHRKRLQKPSKVNWTSRLPYQPMTEIFNHVLTSFIVEGYSQPRVNPMRGRMDRAQRVFRHLAMASYELYCVATPILYDEIYVSTPDGIAALFQAVTEYPHLRPMIHSLHYSSTVFGYGTPFKSQVDESNIEQICSLCSNLHFLTIQRPSHDFPVSDHGILIATGLAEVDLGNLTHLQIHLPQGMPPCTKPILSSGLVLPGLRELILDVSPDSCKSPSEGVSTHDVREHRLQWPRMPKLTKLCIKNLRVKGGCFSFPEHSKNIRIIELLGGDYSSARTFFHRDIFCYVKSLESLVITASDISDDDHLPFKLHRFSGLTEVCVPIQAFARWYKCKLPWNLRRFVVAGDPTRDFIEDDTELLQTVNERLINFLGYAASEFRELKLVRLMIGFQVPADAEAFKAAQGKAGRQGVELLIGYSASGSFVLANLVLPEIS